ncbi:UbiA family prenyltransferase [Brochothrix thermosphacta]|uniref:UbiA family prenyltransferase n=1 Tax=Brochothrix thermosphacta TaxID=2756 RepID=UPI001C4F91FB|nr:UbiA family prenyltransferase [Brochothrix thermosphacta]
MLFGVIGILSLLVGFVYLIISLFMKKKKWIPVLIMVIGFALFIVGVSSNEPKSNDKQQTETNKADDDKKEVSKKEVEKEKMSVEKWDAYKKDFDELVKMSIDANKSIADLASSYSLEKHNNSIAINVKVNQDIKYVSEEQKQKAADGLGQVFYGAASGALATTLGTPDAMSLDIKMHYANDDVLFAENRMIVNPKEFKVKN